MPKQYDIPETSKTLSIGTSTILFDKESGRLYIQVIDSYGFQRELVITKYNDGYQILCGVHPFRKFLRTDLTKQIAEHLIGKIIFYAEVYPDLLFNKGEAQSKGFVTLQEKIMAGERLSVNLF